jgi:hypothetical protein
MANLATLVLFFVGVAMCMWRAPQADRTHLLLCGAAGVLWAMLPLVEPSMRTVGYAFIVSSFLVIGLTQPLCHRQQ